MNANAGFVGLTGRLRVTGGIPDRLIGRPLLLAANHIGNFDAFALVAACRRIGVAPRFLIAGGLLDTPVVGWALRSSGHLRVDRRGNAAEAFNRAVHVLRTCNVPVMVYPEGRISHDPGLWPERGKTGVARLALAAEVPVVPISQWGAHEAAYWGCDVVTGPSDMRPIAASWLRSVVTQPAFRIHFGQPVDLSDLSASRVGDARRARDRIMRAITDGLVGLRADQPDQPRFHDPTRPTDSLSPWRPQAS